MKKILIASAAALCTVIGISATKPTGTKIYFQVEPENGLTGIQSVRDAQVSWLGTTLGSDPCSGASFDCVVTFTTAQLTTGHKHPNTNGSAIPMRSVDYASQGN